MRPDQDKEQAVDPALWNMRLLEAAHSANLSEFRESLSEGADINAFDSESGLTSLHIACAQGNLEIVQEIIHYHRIRKPVNFSARSHFGSRLAWELAMTAHHYNIAHMVGDLSNTGHGDKPGPQLR